MRRRLDLAAQVSEALHSRVAPCLRAGAVALETEQQPKRCCLLQLEERAHDAGPVMEWQSNTRE